MSRPTTSGIDTPAPGNTPGMSTRRVTAVTTAMVAASLALSGCTSTTDGTPMATDTYSNPVPTSTTTTPRSTTPAPDAYADLTTLVQAATIDVSRYWADEGVVVPTRATIVTDQADAPCAPSRDEKLAAQAVAWACDMTTPPAVVVNVKNLNDKVFRDFGDVGTYIVMAHEQGHIGMPLLDPATDTDSDVEERRADCSAGSYFAWVVSGESPSVTVTEQQVGGVATAMWQATPERTKAFAYGLTYGLDACLTYRQ